MENNSLWNKGWVWKKRMIRYWFNNNMVVKILKRICYELKELFWLGIGVGICVIVFKFVFFLGF